PHPGQPAAAQADLRQIAEREGGRARAVAAQEEVVGVAEGALGAGEIAGQPTPEPEIVPQTGGAVAGKQPAAEATGARRMLRCRGSVALALREESTGLVPAPSEVRIAAERLGSHLVEDARHDGPLPAVPGDQGRGQTGAHGGARISGRN